MSETKEPIPASDLILYQTEDGKIRIQCRFEDERRTNWMRWQLVSLIYKFDWREPVRSSGSFNHDRSTPQPWPRKPVSWVHG